MPCQKSIFFSLLYPRGSSQGFSQLWFCIDGIRSPTRNFFFRFPTPFLIPTVLCSRPCHYRPVRIPSPKRLPWSLVLYYASTSTHYLPRPSMQQQDVQWFHIFCDILCSVRLESIFSPPFVLALSWLRMSSLRVSLGSTRDNIRLLVLGRIDVDIPLSYSFRFSWIPLLSANKSSLSITLFSIFFLHQSPHRQVLSISLQSAVSLQLPSSFSPIPLIIIVIIIIIIIIIMFFIRFS